MELEIGHESSYLGSNHYLVLRLKAKKRKYEQILSSVRNGGHPCKD